MTNARLRPSAWIFISSLSDVAGFESVEFLLLSEMCASIEVEKN